LHADKLDKNTRGWVGIGLRNGPETVSETKASPGKNSCKTEGRETSGRHFSEKIQNSLEDSPYEEGSEKDRKKVSLDEKVSSEIVTHPLSWETDGLEIEYMPERE
jgi:hypothetical protein